MNHRDSIALAFAIALTFAAPDAFSQEVPTAGGTISVIKPKVEATGSAATGATATIEAKQPIAVAPAETLPASAKAADIRLPAPELALPSTPPTLAVAPLAPIPADTASKPEAAKAATAPERPQSTKTAETRQEVKSKTQTSALTAPKDPTKQANIRKRTEAKKVAAKAEPAEPVVRPVPKFFFGLFDAKKPELEPLSEEQVQHDQKLAAIPEKKKFKVKEEFVPVTVPFKGYKPGTIVINTKEKYLYFVESPIAAVRYAVAVGKEGLLFTGKATVGAKQPWPRWTPTKEMIARDPKKYGQYSDGMDGGPGNPLGARAIYLYQGKQDTYLRIHGTDQPQTIGTASSNGCFRMINEHVIDLYQRVNMGAEVVVL